MPFDGGLPRRRHTHASRVALKALHLIRTPNRWCQNEQQQFTFRPPFKQRCLLGAIADATHRWGCINEVLPAATTQANHRGYQTIEAFNDHPGRTHPEVVRFLEDLSWHLMERL